MAITIHAPKRSFTIVSPAGLRDSARTLTNADDTRIARNGDRRIARNGDVRVAHNTTSANPILIYSGKRNFTIVSPAR